MENKQISDAEDPNNVCPPLLKCRLHIVTTFQKVQYGKKGESEFCNEEIWQILLQPGDQGQHQHW